MQDERESGAAPTGPQGLPPTAGPLPAWAAIRYTLYTGEPIYGGIMRLWPGPRFWAAFYSVLGFFQLGWPARG